jgi:hypothetical protein
MCELCEGTARQSRDLAEEKVCGRASLALALVDVGNGLRLGPLSEGRSDCITTVTSGAVKLIIIYWLIWSTLMLPELQRTTLPVVGSQSHLLRNSGSNDILLLQLDVYHNWIKHFRFGHYEKKTWPVTGHLTG